ncbi:MAG TPA: hypothetical protein VMC02_02130 [Steroidobacteraceae bacterium]|nr:hypothetical protein [Steroidobacteraceae bacterium]
MITSKPVLFVGAAVVLLGAMAAARASTLTVTGGNGLDGGELCPVTNLTCPATPVFGDTQLPLSGTDPVTGSFTYDAADNLLSFSLTLSQDVTFTDGTHSEVLQAGSIFSASNLTVSVPTPGDPAGTVTGSGGTASASLLINSAVIPGNGSVLVQSISCTTLGSGQCGVQLGGTGGGLNVGSVAGTPYVGDLVINVNVSPVPLPAGLPLLLSGLGAIAGMLAGIPRRRPLRVS